MIFQNSKEILVRIKTSWWIRKCSRQSREENSFYRLCILYNTRNPCPSTNHGLIIGSFPGKSRCSITTVIQLWFPQVTDPKNWAQHLMLLSADICTVYLCRKKNKKHLGQSLVCTSNDFSVMIILEHPKRVLVWSSRSWVGMLIQSWTSPPLRGFIKINHLTWGKRPAWGRGKKKKGCKKMLLQSLGPKETQWNSSYILWDPC